MKGAYHTSWYAQFNVQDLSDCLSSRFDGEEFLRPPFFPSFEQFQAFDGDAVAVGSSITTSPLASESQTRLVDEEKVADIISNPSSWPFIHKILVSILLNAFPLVVAIGTSILSPASRNLVREFDTKAEITVLTTSLFMLVGSELV